MAAHFEELWEQCENLHKAIGNNEPISSIIDELIMKLNVYKVIDQRIEIPPTEKLAIKSRTLGEILMTITNLSLRDNINVFEALSIVERHREVELVNPIPPELRIPK